MATSDGQRRTLEAGGQRLAQATTADTVTTMTTRTHASDLRLAEVGEELTGTCQAWIDKGNGYGFLRVDGYRDVFVSARDLQNAAELRPADRVRFEVVMDRQGRLQAIGATYSTRWRR
ncbi:MAG: cold-shock protein [Vicinamibacterales bacterium]